MSNNDFHTYYTTLNSYRRHLEISDDKSLLAAFNRGLEPHLHHAVVTARPTTLADTTKIAQEIHSHKPPAWMPYMETLYQQVQAATHGQLEQFSQQAGQFIQQQLQQRLPNTSSTESDKMHLNSYSLPQPDSRFRYGPQSQPNVISTLNTAPPPSYRYEQPPQTTPNPTPPQPQRRPSLSQFRPD